VLTNKFSGNAYLCLLFVMVLALLCWQVSLPVGGQGTLASDTTTILITVTNSTTVTNLTTVTSSITTTNITTISSNTTQTVSIIATVTDTTTTAVSQTITTTASTVSLTSTFLTIITNTAFNVVTAIVPVDAFRAIAFYTLGTTTIILSYGFMYFRRKAPVVNIVISSVLSGAMAGGTFS
jgi:hypothetical protein